LPIDRDVPLRRFRSATDAECLSPATRPPLLGLRPSSTYRRASPVARHWFRAPSTSFRSTPNTVKRSSIRARRPAPQWTSRYFRRRRSSTAKNRLSPVPKQANDPFTKLRPLQGMSAASAARLRDGVTRLECTQCLPGVSSPAAHEDRRVYVTSPGLSTPGTFRLQGFSPS